MQFKRQCEICGKTLMDDREAEIHAKEFHNLTIEQQLPKKVSKPLDINLDYHMFISGQTQTGKSVVAKYLFATLPITKRAIFLDVKNDPNHDNFIKHFQVFTKLEDIIDFYNSGNKKGIFSKKQKDLRIVYRPKRQKSESMKTHSLENPNWKMFNELCEYAYNLGNIIIFVDEAAVFSTPHNIVPAMYDCLIMGTSRGVILVNLTQRPAIIHNSIISEAYTRFLFRTELESDRTKIKGFVGQEVADKLHSLPNKQFIVSYVNGKWEPGTLILQKKFEWIVKKP